MSWVNSLVERRYRLDEFREHMCALPKVPKITDNACMASQFLQFASWGLVLAVVLSFVAMLAGAALLYRYVYVRPKAVLRVWTRIAYALALLLQLGGLAQYAWAANLVVQMYPRTGGAHLGHSVVFGASASLGSVAVLFVLVVLVGKSTEEQFNEAVSEQKKLIRDDPELYGSAGGTATGAPAEAAAYEGGAFHAENAFGAVAQEGAYGGGACGGGYAYGGGGAYGGGTAYGAAGASYGNAGASYGNAGASYGDAGAYGNAGASYGGAGAFGGGDQGACAPHGDFGIQPGYAPRPEQPAGWSAQTAGT
mmetsp:Transcript_75809/g.197657  ORF Transcript_75809/g.197657 Transcript_75809/m.197657 type:complete len:308 (+) Transcript_75809:304-1227(+)